MAKRFHDNEIWSQDWFADMPSEYKMFWFWIVDKCDHAGVWKPNKKMFEMLNEVKIELNEALNFFNQQKERIHITQKEHWYLIDFFHFQYGEILNENNKVHESILNIFEFEGITRFMVRGLIEVKLKSIRPRFEDKDRVKDKDKEKDKDNKGVLKGDDLPTRPQNGVNSTSLESLQSEFNKKHNED